MEIISLIDNESSCEFSTEHGLSLFIALDNGTKILFDMGQSALFYENAKKSGVDLADVDVAIISHGHYDHGGGLRKFLEINSTAKVYIRENAFLPHYSQKDFGLKYNGLDEVLKTSDRLVFSGEEYTISESLLLFSNVVGDRFKPLGNKLLFGPEKEKNDDFSHEQNLLISENGRVVLFAGCAHAGIVNILNTAKKYATPTVVFSGMHLIQHEYSDLFYDEFCEELLQSNVSQFYTMHCTGIDAFGNLKKRMGELITYFSCGEILKL